MDLARIHPFFHSCNDLYYDVACYSPYTKHYWEISLTDSGCFFTASSSLRVMPKMERKWAVVVCSRFRRIIIFFRT
jgi:hypothetical protein